MFTLSGVAVPFYEEVTDTVSGTAQTELAKRPISRKGRYIIVPTDVQSRLSQLVKQVNRCFEGSNRRTIATDQDELNQIKLALAKEIRRYKNPSVDSQHLWIDRDEQHGIHVYVFRVNATSRKAFKQAHAHYYVEANGRIRIYHEHRKSFRGIAS